MPIHALTRAVSVQLASSVAYNEAMDAIEQDGLLIDAAATDADLSTHEADTSTHGVGTVAGISETQTLTNKTLTTPTISATGFTNAQHAHAAANSGGQLTDAALSAAVGIAKGGTGQTAATAAFDALAPTTTQGDTIYHNGTDNVRLAKGVGLQLYRMNAGATAPEWATPPAAIVFDVTDPAYGAVGDGVADDTAAIIAANAAAEAVPGGIVFFPQGDYLAVGASTEIFLIVKSVYWQGAGGHARILVDSAVPGTRDVIRYAPDALASDAFFSVRDLRIVPVSGTPARHGIVLDPTVTASLSLRRFLIEGCWIGQFGGAAVSVSNGTGTTPTTSPGVYTGDIHRNQLYGGVALIGAADSIAITRNVLTGSGYAVEADLISGAALLDISSNNITSLGGILVNGAHHVSITNNYLEFLAASTPTPSNNAMIDLNGATRELIHPVIVNNTINAAPPADGISCIRLGNTRYALVANNDVSTEAAVYAILVGASALDSDVFNNPQYGAGLNITNAGDPRLNVGIKAFALMPSGVAAGSAWIEALKAGTLESTGATVLSSLTLGTDLAVAEGGTGASTAAEARTNLELVAGATGDIWVEKAGDTMTGALVVANTLTVRHSAVPLAVSRFSADTGGSGVNFNKSRNATPGSHTILQSGDQTGVVSFLGSDGVTFQPAATIAAEVDGTPGANDMPGRLVFLVSPDGSVVPAEALRISQDKRATFAGAVEVDGAFDHDGTTFGALGVAPATQDAANADTSGATLAALETEVNEIKATLRRFGYIAP